MFDPLIDLIIATASVGAAIGYIVHWASTPEGAWWIQWRLFKRPAKILLTFIPGRLIKQEVVIPKTDSHQKQPNFLQKLLGKEADPHTLLLGWFRSDAPIYRRVGSAAQYIINRKGETNAFDIDKVEYGLYQQTKESQELMRQAVVVEEKNLPLIAEYEKAWNEKRGDDAERIKTEIDTNIAEINDLVSKANASRSFYRVTSLPSQTTTAILDNEKSYMKAKELKGFLGKLEAILKNLNIFLIAAAAFAAIAAFTGVMIAMKTGAIKIG